MNILRKVSGFFGLEHTPPTTNYKKPKLNEIQEFEELVKRGELDGTYNMEETLYYIEGWRDREYKITKYTDNSGRNVFHVCCQYGHYELFEYLIDYIMTDSNNLDRNGDFTRIKEPGEIPQFYKLTKKKETILHYIGKYDCYKESIINPKYTQFLSQITDPGFRQVFEEFMDRNLFNDDINNETNDGFFHDIIELDDVPHRFIFKNTHGDIKILEKLHEIGVLEKIINSRDSDGNTALHNAVKSKNSKLISELIKYGADYNISNNIGETPFWSETDLSNLSVLVLSIKEPQILENVFNIISREFLVSFVFPDGKNLLHYACEYGNIYAIFYLLDKDIDVIPDNDGKTPSDFLHDYINKHNSKSNIIKNLFIVIKEEGFKKFKKILHSNKINEEGLFREIISYIGNRIETQNISKNEINRVFKSIKERLVQTNAKYEGTLESNNTPKKRHSGTLKKSRSKSSRRRTSNIFGGTQKIKR